MCLESVFSLGMASAYRDGRSLQSTHLSRRECVVWLVFGSSTCDSSIIFAFQLLIASHKQLGGFWGAEPPVLAFSLRVLGSVSQEYDVLVFSL